MSLPRSSKILVQHIHITCTSLFVVIILLILNSILLPTSTASAAHVALRPIALNDPRELETFLDGVLTSQLKENHIPGATLSVVKDGKLFLAKGYGDADIEQNKPVVADTTLFRIGSISKMFTWTAILQLAEEGKVNLHTDINTYLKTFKIPATYPQPITLENLLTHTAGFEDSGKGIFVAQASDLQPLGKWLPNHIPARVRSPGVFTSYSNYGATLAGYIVEQVSGVSYDQYVEQHLLQPLNMKHSTSRQPLPSDFAPNISQGYTYTNGTYRADPFENVEIAPAGALSATATDMANFMIAHLQYGRFGNTRILQEATAAMMQQQHFTNDPRVAGMGYGFYEQHINNLRVLEHAGDTGLFHSLMALLTPQHVGLFISFNSVGGEKVRDTVVKAFMDRYFPASNTAATRPLPGFADRADQIVGSYWPTRRNETTYQKLLYLFGATSVSDSGKGHLTISGEDAVEITPWVFYNNVSQQTVVFRNDSRGSAMFIDNAPYEGFTKMAWYATPNVQYLVLAVCILLFLSTLLRWPLRLFRALRLRFAGKPMISGFRSPLALWLGWIVSLLNIVSVLGLVQLFTGDQNALTFATPPLLTVLIVLVILSAFLTIGMLMGNILMWDTHAWSWGQRIYYMVLTVAAFLFIIDLAYWNLLKLPA